MIIHSIRLKHIKSYGAGPEGSGVTVPFQPGVNRIAGLNGHGKTTLIEALGYALFLADPLFEEHFKPETYLLSHGAKTGEIDVTFSVKAETYRLERGIGTQSKRRAKVMQVADGSLCAEGDQEVAAFLCRLLELPSPDRLREMFSKLIGVKQGRLTWPFDSKPSHAKGFFEPLLEVEVFRQCFDRLKPAVDRFVHERGEHEKREAALGERIRERADSACKLAEAQAAVAGQTAAVESSAKAREAALSEKSTQEALERAVTEARAARDRAEALVRNAAERRAEAEVRVREAEQADRTVRESASAHDAYQAAERALKTLEEQRKVRDVLRQQRERAEAERKDRASQGRAAREQIELLTGQQRAKVEARNAMAGRVTRLQEELESGQAAFDQDQAAAGVASADATTSTAWIGGLPSLVKRLQLLGAGIVTMGVELATWNPVLLETARQAQEDAADRLAEVRDVLAKAQERRETLAAQLEQIAGGVCPFLKESCGQFDAAKVQADLSTLDAELIELTQRAEAAQHAQREAEECLQPLVTADHQRAGKRERLGADLTAYTAELQAAVSPAMTAAVERLRAWDAKICPLPARIALPERETTPEDVQVLQQSIERFSAEAETWWGGASLRIADRLQEIANAKTDRTRSETTLRSLTEQLEGLAREIIQLGEDTEGKALEAARFEEEAAGFVQKVERLDEALKPHETLDGEIDGQVAVRDTNKAGYESFLRAKPQAEDLENRRGLVDQRRQEEGALAAILGEREETLVKAQEAFDPEKLALAREEYDKKVGEATAAETNLKHAKLEQAMQETRFGEWGEAVDDHRVVLREIARCNAAIDLTELARRTLRDAAPAVAQHLCNRIATRAQAVFNQINPDPVELAWDAERYSLRITPGDRRFAMLSGGEQTKLALAMTLAMVEEFSRLRFCIFDEPTYGVDADSRSKLADAILQAQEAAGLDQLLLVSHDDAFEGKIEHAVLLRKSVAAGTAVLVQ